MQLSSPLREHFVHTRKEKMHLNRAADYSQVGLWYLQKQPPITGMVHSSMSTNGFQFKTRIGLKESSFLLSISTENTIRLLFASEGWARRFQFEEEPPAESINTY